MATPGSGGSGSGGNSGDPELFLKTGTDAPETISDIEKLNATFNRMATTLDAVASKLDSLATKQDKVKRTTVELTAAEKEALATKQAAIALQAEADALADRQIAAGNRLIAQLQDQIAIFGMTSIEVKQYRADLMGIGDIARPLTKELEALTRAQFELTVQQKRDIEGLREYQAAFMSQQKMVEDRDVWLHNQRGRDYADYISWWEKTLATEQANQEKMAAIGQSRDLWHHEQRAKEYADYISWWEKTIAAEEAKAAKIIEIQQRRDVELNNMRNAQIAAEAETAAKRQAIIEGRDMQEFRERTRIVNEEIKLAEHQAIMDIRYAELTVAKKIEVLEKYKAYQARALAGDITQATMAKTFAPAAVMDLPNLAAMQAYAKMLEEVETKTKKAAHAAEGLNVTNKSFARELIVIGHEFVTGNWSRIPGSIMVLGERMNAAALLFSGMGLATLGVVAALGTLGYAYVKGLVEQKAFNDALIFTGNYAGVTADKLNEMAHAASATHGSIAVAKEAVAQLAATGKFTGDQIGTIANAVTQMESATGQSIDTTIKQFETLAVQTTGVTQRMSDGISKALLKLDDQYHFLSLAIYEEIRAMERQGDQIEASKRATDLYAETLEKRTKESLANMGLMERGWHAIKRAITETIDAMGNIGKKNTPASALAKAEADLKAFDNEKNTVNPLTGKSDGNASAQDRTSQLKAIENGKERLKLEQAVKAAKEEVQVMDYIANKEAESKLISSKAIHAAEQIITDDIRLQKKGQSELQIALDRYKQQIIEIRQEEQRSGVMSKLATEEAVKAREAAIIKEHTEKVKPPKAIPNDGRATDLRAELDAMKGDYKLVEDWANKKIQLLKDSARVELGLDHDKFDQMRALLDVEQIALDGSYAARIKSLEAFRGRNATENASARKAITDLTVEYRKSSQNIAEAREKIDSTENLDSQKAYQDMMRSMITDGQKQLNQLDKAIEKQELYNATVGKTPEQVQLAKAQLESERIAQLELDAVFLQGILLREKFEPEAQAAYQKRLDLMQAEIAKSKELQQLEATGATLQSTSPDVVGKLADEAAKKWKNAGDDIKKSLKDAFGGAGEAMGKMFAIYADNKAEQIKIDNEYSRKVAAAQDTTDEYTKIQLAGQERSYEMTRNQIAGYGQMADAAAGFFDEQSTGYKTLHAVAQVFHMAEMAMIVMKIGQQAISAVLNQGSGDPYTAFARMAAMAAVVTGLGVAISASQAGAQRMDVAKTAQETQGTGTVLGDSKAKSDSIAKSLELLGDNSDIALKYTSQMASSLRNIENGIGGLANIIYRTAGMTTGENFGIAQGVMSVNKGDPVANALGLGGLADKLLLPGLSGIASKLQSLWGNTTQTIVDTGLTIKGSINDLMNGQGVQQYANVETKKSSWFGLVKDYSYNTVNQDANGEIAKQFGQIFKDLNTTLEAAGGALGMSSQRLQEALGASNATVDPTSFKDLKGQELIDALNAVVSKASDQIAEAVLPGLQDFMKVGEGYAQTAVRVAAGVEKAQLELTKLGISAINYADIVNKQGDPEAEIVRQSLVARETTTIMIQSWNGWFGTLAKTTSGIGQIMDTLSGTADEMIASYQALVEIRRIMLATNTNPYNSRTGGNLTQATVAGAGSLDALAQGSKDFLDKYYTEAEKAKIETAKLTDEFAKIGLKLPVSKDEFRSLLAGIDQTSEGGQRLYGQMITLSGSFAALMDSAEQASEKSNTIIEDQLARVNALTQEAQRWLSVRTSASNLQDTITTNMGGKPDTSARQEALWAMLALGDKITPEQQLSLATELQDLILKKYQTEKANATDLLNVAKSLRTYLDSLKVGDLAPGTNTDKLNEAKSQYELTLSKAQGGDAAAAGDLQSKAETYLRLARDYYASSDPYKQIFASVYTSLDQYAVTAASAEQLAAEGNAIAQGQLDELGQLRDIVAVIMEKADSSYNSTVVELQNSLNVLQQIYTALNVLSTVPDLLAAMPADLNASLQFSVGAPLNGMTAAVVGIISAQGPANDRNALAITARADETNRLLAAILESQKAITTAATSSGNATNASGGAVPPRIVGWNELYFQHANGLNYVPYDGYQAELHRGERVLTARENEDYTFKSVFNAGDDEKVLTSTANRASMGAGNNGASNGVAAQEIKALREEIAALRKEQAQQHQEAIATNYDANDRAANKVATATCDAADKTAWANRSAATMR